MSPVSHRMMLQHHERFGQWHVPNLRAYVPHERGYYVVRTNSVGMRASRNYAAAPPAGVSRLLLFGDSFTAGEGVDNEERFSDLLERLLEGVEVLNFGLDGSGTDQHLLIFETLGSQCGGDLVLYCPLVENIRRVTVPCWPVLDRTTGATVCVPKPYFSLEGGRLELHNVPVPRQRLALDEAPPEVRKLLGTNGHTHHLARLIRQAVAPLKPAMMRVRQYQPFPQYASPDHPAWRLTWALLERLITAAGDRAVVIAPLPLYYYIERLSPPVYLERYREFAEAHPAVHVLNLLPYFHALSPEDRRRCRYPRDEHYTPFGHQVVASALRIELARRGLPLHREVEAV